MIEEDRRIFKLTFEDQRRIINKEITLLDLVAEKQEEIERLNREVEKYKKRCYEALTLIRENYGVLDKYGIDMLDDILNGK